MKQVINTLDDKVTTSTTPIKQADRSVASYTLHDKLVLFDVNIIPNVLDIERLKKYIFLKNFMKQV